MTYTDIGTYLFLFWWAGCWVAYFMSRWSRANRDTRLIPMLFGIIIGTFYVCMHGRAGHWHHWWYAWNAIPNGALMLVAWFAPEARARIPLLVISIAGILVDATYFSFAYSGHRLPGYCYFCAAATIETLQILTMLYFSGPVEPVTKKAWTFISTRKWPWTHQQFQRV